VLAASNGLNRHCVAKSAPDSAAAGPTNRLKCWSEVYLRENIVVVSGLWLKWQGHNQQCKLEVLSWVLLPSLALHQRLYIESDYDNKLFYL